jgi:two-component system, OmpR family, sensor histidine kinase KdpD
MAEASKSPAERSQRQPGSELDARQRSVPTVLSELAPSLFVLDESHHKRPWAGYLKSALVIGAITCVGLLIGIRQAPTNVAMLYLLGVVFAALRWGFGPAFFSAFASTVVFDYIFIPPYLSFAITDTWYLITLIAMMSIGILISVLASAAREQTLAAKERAAHIAALYTLTQSLSAAHGTDQVLRAGAEHVQRAFGRAVSILLSEENDELVLRYQTPGWELDAEARSKAERIVQQALDGSTTWDHGTFLPLRYGARVLGMVVLLPPNTPLQVSSGGERVLQGVASQIALAIDRTVLEARAREADILRRADELHRTLLNSVSHSLRAPLAAILSALDPIADTDAVTSSAGIVELARVAQDEAYRLDRLVTNLLDLSRLEAGALRPKREPHNVQNLVGAALAELKKSPERRVEAVVPSEVPDVFVDFGLMVRVLVNLLENAAKYSSADLPVGLDARATDGQVEIRVSDYGCGIPTTERERIFQRFFRGTRNEDVPGIGLGLAVSKGFVEAHNGKIWVEERPGGGSVFCFTMPLQDR